MSGNAMTGRLMNRLLIVGAATVIVPRRDIEVVFFVANS
jgi:hypothetical protein